jgi:hypothetical protein
MWIDADIIFPSFRFLPSIPGTAPSGGLMLDSDFGIDGVAIRGSLGVRID